MQTFKYRLLTKLSINTISPVTFGALLKYRGENDLIYLT